MSEKVMERMLNDLLRYFLALDDDSLHKHLQDPYRATKERVKTINDLQVIIYPNDHLPAHFHVKSKDRKIDVKFTIESCELISGDINSKNRKKIEAFASSMKGQMALKTIWKRYHG